MKPGRLLVTLILFAAPIALAAEPAGTTLPWNILDCEFAYGTVLVPAPLLAPYMPHNFRPMVVSPALANTLAQVGFEVNVCAEGSGLAGQVSPMLYASTWTPALAPAPLAVPGVGMFVNWDTLVPDDDRRETLTATGTPAVDGDVRISTSLRTQPTTPFSVDYTLGEHAFRFDIVPAPAPAGAGGGAFAQYTADADGELTYWRTEWAATASYRGAGVITLDPESWQAEAFGTTVLPAQFSFGTWDYTNGKIVVPS